MPAVPLISRWRIWVGRPGKGTDLLPRVLVGLGVAATVAQNVAAGSRGGYGGALMGVLPPAGMLLALETLIWMVRRLAGRSGSLWWILGAGLPLVALAGITGVISYLHSLTVAQWTAAPGEIDMSLTEHLLPLVADLMIATGSVALVALARSRARHRDTGSGSHAGHMPAQLSPARRRLLSRRRRRVRGAWWPGHPGKVRYRTRRSPRTRDSSPVRGGAARRSRSRLSRRSGCRRCWP